MLLVAALAIAACMASVSFADMDWDLARDYSTTANPNGDWSYGVYLEDAYGFSIYNWVSHQDYAGNPDLTYWGNPGDDSLTVGAIFDNPSTTNIFSGYGLWLRPGEVMFHPAAYDASYCPFIRWTAPADMDISIDAEFTGHADSATTDVLVLLNGDMNDGSVYVGTPLFDGYVQGNAGCSELGIAQSGATPVQSYQGTISVHAGDYIDFFANAGGNGYGGDPTGVSAKITQVPEPGTWIVLATGLIGLLVWRKRK
jgi:hypothetical protein